MSLRKRPWLGGVVALLLLAASLASAQQLCRMGRANRQGTARADLVISTTAVTVVGRNETLCGALILNCSTSQAMRCAFRSDGAPTATAGQLVPVGQKLELGYEASDGILCIRDTSATGDSCASVTELFPLGQ
jgi:hypothetical protein